MAKKQLIRLTESDLHKIIKESVKNVLEGKDIPYYPLNTHIHDNQDTESETLAKIIDELKKIENGVLSKWNKSIANKLQKDGLVDAETISIIDRISMLIYHLSKKKNFSHEMGI
jgi:hypothetical protein